MKDYYHILQISPEASQQEVKQAFRRLAKVYHPDVAQGEEEAEQIQEINEAYKILSNPEKRFNYDWLRTHQTIDLKEAPKASPAADAKTGTVEVKPYLKYTYIASRVALVFSLLLIIDFSLPMKQRIDKAIYVVKAISNKADQLQEHARLQTWSGRTVFVSKEAGKYFEKNPNLILFSTPILGKARYVAPAGKRAALYSIARSIYNNFSYLPLLLLLPALLGTFKRFSPELDFSLGLVSGLLLLISVGLLVI